MLISVINHTRGRKKITDARLQEVIRAVNRQIAEDFVPAWSMPARLRLEGHSMSAADTETSTDMRGDAILYLLTSVADQDGTLGFHEKNSAGIPYGFVYTEISEQLGEPWSVTFSHEALELIADPEANLLVMGPEPEHPETTVFHWFEMCDAVQAQQYEIDGVTVSNFVLPLYYTGTPDEDEPGARNNFLGTPLTSFGIAAGGYIGFYDPAINDHRQVFGPDEAKGRRRSEIKSSATETRRALRYKNYKTRTTGRLTVLRAAAAAPPPPKILTAKDLRPGDVMLYQGTALVSKAIILFDGRPVSHAALHLGNGQIGEAVGEGVVQKALPHTFDQEAWAAVRRLATPPNTFQPVLDRAGFYLSRHDRYAYEQVLLLAFLGISRRIPVNGITAILLRKILDSAAEVLNRLASLITAGGKEPMICSEFVYRCYEEAKPEKGDVYALKVGPSLAAKKAIAARAAQGDPTKRAIDSTRGRGIERGSLLEVVSDEKFAFAAPVLRLGARADAGSGRSLDQLIVEYQRQGATTDGPLPVTQDLHASLAQFAYALHRAQAVTKAPAGRSGRRGAATLAAAAPDPATAVANLFATVKDFVTPGDLYESQSLVTVGRLDPVAAVEPHAFAAAWRQAAAQPRR